MAEAAVFNCKSGMLDLIQFIRLSFARIYWKIHERFNLTRFNATVFSSFHVNFVKFFKNTFFKNTSGRLLLDHIFKQIYQGLGLRFQLHWKCKLKINMLHMLKPILISNSFSISVANAYSQILKSSHLS